MLVGIDFMPYWVLNQSGAAQASFPNYEGLELTQYRQNFGMLFAVTLGFAALFGDA